MECEARVWGVGERSVGVRQELIIADGAAPEILRLLEGATAPAVAITACTDPVQAITAALAGERLRTLHLLTHGRPGAIRLGGHWLTAADLERQPSLPTTWQVDEIVVWGCSVAAEDSLVQALARLTGATVYGTGMPLGRQDGFANFDVSPVASGTGPSKSLADLLSPLSLQQMDFVLADLSVYFTSGYFGTQGSNTNQANNIKTFASLGIARVAFVQADTDNDGLFDEVATQGNDIAGTIRIVQTNGTVTNLTGALNWRETEQGVIQVLGFIFGTGQSATITNGTTSFTITGGSTRNSSTTLGLKTYLSDFTFTDGTNRSGNAATSGLLDALNAELTNAPQPASVTLAASSVTEGSSLVYTVTMNKSPNSTQYYSLVTSGAATSGSDFNATYTFSDGVTLKSDGTLEVPSGVSSFTVTVTTIDDASVEASETLTLQIGNKSATASILDNDGPRLSYSGTTLNEAAANNGSISTTITITLSGDTFTGADNDNFTTAGKVTVSNVPSGLTAVVTRTSSTTATLTLTGNAGSHANAQDISNLTVAFGNTAFTGGSASAVTDATKDNLAVNFNDPPSLSYSGTTFYESTADDGTIRTTLTITLANDTFAADVVSAGRVTASGVPGGLAASFTRISDTQITVTLTGTAGDHATDVTTLGIAFSNGAFTNTATAANVSGYQKSDLIVDFNAPAPTLTYTGSTLSEANANDGTISTSITITLTNDSFTGVNGDNLIGGKVTVTNVPAGLTAVITRTSDTTATLTLTGAASAHADTNGISNLTVAFDTTAFTGGSSVPDRTKNNLVVDFNDPPSLSYSASTFTEAGANNGSISTSITITLTGDTFTANAASLITATNVPPGLTASFTRVDDNNITATLTGNATSHANVHDINNLTFTFGNGAFTNTTTAANVTGYRKNDLVVDFATGAALSYSSTTLNEAAANNGSVSTTITITLSGDTFTGANNDNFTTAGKVTVSNVPSGLTAVVTRTSSTTATLTLTGNASSHANAHDISNLTVAFGNTAFTGGNASGVTDGTRSDLVVDFDDSPPAPPPPTYSAILDPSSDTGTRDSVTSMLDPRFALNAGNLLSTGGSARLLAPDGRVIGSAAVTAADIAAGRINVPTELLDDGVYTFTSQILDTAGNVTGSAPVTVTIVTDRDGVAPSIELAANNGDFNRDGIKDWLQNNVAQLPLASMTAYNAGKDAPATSFGAVMAGNVNVRNLSQAVQLDAGAQLVDVFLSDLPTTPLPSEVTAVTPLFDFTVTSATNAQLTDIDPSRPGLQTRVTIDLPTGVVATAFVKYNASTGAWTDFASLASLKGGGDGAALIDTNNDGKVDRIIITLTDGGPGDEDGIVNGTIIDPGALAVTDVLPVYSLLQKKKETPMAAVAKSIDSRLDFYVTTENAPGTVRLKTWYNKLTGDYFYAPEGTATPYRCYVERPDLELGRVYAVGEGAFDVHLYLNKKGRTELMSQDAAVQANLIGLGYKDMGAVFGSADPIASLFGG